MTGYSWLTLAQAKTDLAQRLDDSGKVYWVDAELGAYITEALRTWQALSRNWRGRMQFEASPANSLQGASAFFDLTAQANTLIPYTVKDTDIDSVLCYHLIESQPTNAGVWQGTDMFTMDDLEGALQRRRDQFLVETGMIEGRLRLPMNSPPIGELILPDNVIDVRRAAWNDTPTNGFTNLWMSDEWTAQGIEYAWGNTPATLPIACSITAVQPVALQILPPPKNDGNVELLCVLAGKALDPTAGAVPPTGTLLGVPDDFTWVIKWGALADLLSREGQSKDPLRAKYCEQRYQQGVIAARAWNSALTCYIDGAQVPLDSLAALDAISPGWQATSGAPTVAALACWNVLALSPVVGTSGPYSVEMDVLRNAPIPANDAAYLQLSREDYEAVLGYSQHLASFKQGGSEFEASVPLWQNMLRMALLRNERLAAASKSVQPMWDRSTQEERERVRRDPAIPVEVGPEL